MIKQRVELTPAQMVASIPNLKLGTDMVGETTEKKSAVSLAPLAVDLSSKKSVLTARVSETLVQIFKGKAADVEQALVEFAQRNGAL